MECSVIPDARGTVNGESFDSTSRKSLRHTMNSFESVTERSILSIVGAGGKTSLLFYLAEVLPWNCLVTTTTKVGRDQISSADRIVSFSEFLAAPDHFSGDKIVWVSPAPEQDYPKVKGFDPAQFSEFAEAARKIRMPILVEADGAHRLHLKAPAENEPVVPAESDHILDVVGLDVIGLTISERTVHRLSQFLKITGYREGDIIDESVICRAILHPQGGFKNAPQGCCKIAVLNQADTAERIKHAENISNYLLKHGVDEVWITSLDPETDKNKRGIIKELKK